MNTFFNALDKLEIVERKLNNKCNMLGTITGIFLILLTVAITIFSIYIIVNLSSYALDQILREFFNIRLF